VPLVRQRRLRRGARRRGGELSDPAGAIRPAVEAALAVAREGLAADPAVPPPQALRRYLGFSRLSSGALRAIARVVERDDVFRGRVAASVDEDTVGRAGWLWLHRPEGWADELADIESEAAVQAEEEQRAREERSAVKKLAAAQAAAAQAAAEAEERGRQVEALRAELERQRALQADVGARLVAAESEADRLAAARTEVIRNLKDVEARFVERSTELNAAKARIRELEERIGARSATSPDEPAGRPGSDGSGDGDVPAGEVVSPSASPASPPPPSVSPPTAPRDALVRELAQAAAGAASLADSLAALAGLLDPASTDGGGDGDGGAPVPGADGSVGTAGAVGGADGADGVGVEPARRTPVRLPGGIFDDSAEAAEHLLRTPGVVLVVDGYNVTMTGWPTLAAADQRRRLVAVLAELAARTSTEVDIVFDGADVDAVRVPAPVRSLVHVRFSPAEVEADDVILELVAHLPAARPVVVASSDNQVRDGARALGANVVHARQLLDALRR
jgi:predicted RNA-binding protein with PIN domain